jgi:site-specific recombinase XerD
MYYYRSEKDPYSVNFTHVHVCELSENSTQYKYTANQMKEKIPLFHEVLRKYQYSKPVLLTSETALRLLFIVLDMSNVHYSAALADSWIASEGHRLFKSSFVMARRGIELFDEYIKVGTIDPCKWKKRSPSEVELLPEWCRISVVHFIEQKTKEGRSPREIYHHGHAAAKLCQFLIEKGVIGFNLMTPEIIKEFNLQNHHRTATGKNAFNGIIRKFLIFLYRECFYDQPNLHLALPSGSVSRERIIDVLTADEKKQIQLHKEKSISPLELRDTAIIEIGLKMGFRGQDIINLKLSDIDWKSRTIRLIQSKTSVEIWLPMSNGVGNAIYRYIKEGRPSVIDDSHVFLKARAPYGLISPAVCRHAMERVLPERNILGSKFHVTRRTFATDLLKKETKTSMIADALGHSNIGTIHKYLSLDEERMRLCSLSLTEIGLMSDRRTWNE